MNLNAEDQKHFDEMTKGMDIVNKYYQPMVQELLRQKMSTPMLSSCLLETGMLMIAGAAAYASEHEELRKILHSRLDNALDEYKAKYEEHLVKFNKEQEMLRNMATGEAH